MNGYPCHLPRSVIAGCPLIAAVDLPPVTLVAGPAFAGVAVAAPAPTAAAIADYRRKLKEYLAAREAFEAEASTYWDQIVAKRRGRNAKRRNHLAVMLDDYVLTQPPAYSGPKRPVSP